MSVDDGEMIFSEDASGTIELSDGSTIDFDGIESLSW